MACHGLTFIRPFLAESGFFPYDPSRIDQKGHVCATMHSPIEVDSDTPSRRNVLHETTLGYPGLSLAHLVDEGRLSDTGILHDSTYYHR